MDTTREQREAARTARWNAQRPAIRAEWEAWLRVNVDVKAPFQIAQDGAGVGLEPSKKGRGFTLHLPVSAVRRLEKLAYRPKMPAADPDHQRELTRIAKRLYALLDELKASPRQVLPTVAEQRAFAEHCATLASRYRNLRGGYYIKHKPRSKENARDKCPDNARHAENWEAWLARAEGRGEHEVVWACELALEGLPEQFTDFWIEPLFVLVRPDHTKVRMVNIRTANGELFGFDKRKPFGPENRPLELTPEFAVQPSKLREWLQRHASGGWGAGGAGGGEKELQALHYDLNKGFAWDEVHEVAQLGWHPQSGAWFKGDMAVSAEGVPMVPNEEGFYQLGRKRWMLAERDREGIDFQLPPPLMRPVLEMDEAGQARRNRRREVVVRPQAAEEAYELLRSMDFALQKVVGGPDARMALGSVLAYAAGPEIFAEHRSFGGLWFHGPKGSGKNTVGSWLVAIHGWGPNGVNLQSGTVAALENGLAQLRFEPLLMDEFQTVLKDGVIWLIKQAFDQTKTSKMVGPKGGGRVPGTAPIVMGQATSGDPATKSRYPHVLIVKERRADPTRENFKWLKANRGQFHKIGRALLERRQAFAAATLRRLQGWLDSEDAQERVNDDRARLVHGVSYAALLAAFEVLGGKGPSLEQPEFREWLLTEAERSEGEVREGMELEKFWQKVEGCLALGGFGETKAELQRFFRVQVVPPPAGVAAAKPPGVPAEAAQLGAWKQSGTEEFDPAQSASGGAEQHYVLSSDSDSVWLRLRLCIAYGPMFEALSAHARKQGETLPLRPVDVRSELKNSGYFLPPKRTPKGEKGKEHFGENGSQRYWYIDFDEFHTWGYCPCSDALWTQWHRTRRASGATGDPRLGPLYQIAAKLLHPPGTA